MEIPKASALLFYGGTKPTEWVGNRLYHYPYKPPAFHAAFYIQDGLFLNVGDFRIIQELSLEMRSARRIDVIIFKNISDSVRIQLCNAALLDSSHPKVGLDLPDYAFTDYLRFGLRFLRPSKKEFCSENVVHLFLKGDIMISDKLAVDTAPWDLQTYAETHSESCELRTLWVGPDFHV